MNRAPTRRRAGRDAGLKPGLYNGARHKSRVHKPNLAGGAALAVDIDFREWLTLCVFVSCKGWGRFSPDRGTVPEGPDLPLPANKK
jgi:hypothetical protein